MQLNRTISGPQFVPTRYLRQAEVLARVGVSWITILRWERKGLFPLRRRLGPNSVAWVEAEVEQWCADRAAANSTARL